MLQPLNDWAKGCPKTEPSAGKGTHESMQVSQGYSRFLQHQLTWEGSIETTTPGRTNVSSTTWTKWLYILYRPASKYNTDWFCIVDTALLTLILLKGSAALWIGSVFFETRIRIQTASVLSDLLRCFLTCPRPSIDCIDHTRRSVDPDLNSELSELRQKASECWKIPLEVVDSLLMYLLWKTTIKHKS